LNWCNLPGYRTANANISDKHLNPDYDFSLRTRYQLGVRSSNYNILFKNGIYLTGPAELFWNSEDDFLNNTVNRIRFDLGAGTKVSDAWRVELPYLLQDNKWKFMGTMGCQCNRPPFCY
jgi:hypothetical protein